MNVLVGQSGGPTTAINASLCGVIRESLNNSEIGVVYGMRNGIEGFMKDDYVNLNSILDKLDLNMLKVTPSSFLGSCRYKLPMDINDKFYEEFFEKIEKLDIGMIFYIGGNDSMDTVSKLSRYVKEKNKPTRVIGVPKTIDNDLTLTDHSPGYGSAAKFVATTVREINFDVDVYEKKCVTIVEVMGRDAGWLTASSVAARRYEDDNPVLIYLPEVAFNLENFYKDVENALSKRNAVVVCVSEGIKDESGKLVCELMRDVESDVFGHKKLTGCGKILEDLVAREFKVKTRSVELNTPQRCAATLASLTDLNESENAGKEAVKAGLRGETGKMVAFKRESGDEYKISYTLEPIGNICNKEQSFPIEWINDERNDILPEFLNYLIPLMSGEVEIKKKNGLPLYCILSEILKK